MQLASQTESRCRFCGDLSIAASGIEVDGYHGGRFTYGIKECAEIFGTICERHLNEFEKWLSRRSAPTYIFQDFRPRTEDFSLWVAMSLQKLAKLKRAGSSIRRCEIIYNGESWTGNRCYRYAAREWEGHQICQIHHGVINHHCADTSIFRFCDGESPQVLRLNKMLEEFLA